jgi:hypothetical protein
LDTIGTTPEKEGLGIPSVPHGQSGAVFLIFHFQNHIPGEYMTTQVTATFVGGVLKPDQTLPLADQTRVHLTIEPMPQSNVGGRLAPMAVWQSLKTWIQQNPLHGLGRHLTRDELHERR